MNRISPARPRDQIKPDAGRGGDNHGARRVPKAIRIGVLTVLPIAFATAAYFILSQNPELSSEKKLVGVTVAVAFSLMLASFPLLISYSQTIARDRQLTKLQGLEGAPIENTRHYSVAIRAVRRLQPFTLDDDYFAPMIAFEVVLISGCLSVLLATFVDRIFEVPSFLYGGMRAATARLSDNPSSEAVRSLADYQRGTFIASAMAFFGSYVYMLYRLLDRVNNNDIYPISYYYYASRIIIASIVAIVFRHVAVLLGSPPSGEAAILIGFMTGFAPDLFILAMGRKAFQAIKVIGSQPDPEEAKLPTNMNLFMVEGMSRDKVDRLNELGIDSAQSLALQNPLLLWSRLPFDLSLLVNWLGQAQLYLWGKEAKTKALREVGISTIFDLYTCLSDPGSRSEMARMLGVGDCMVDAYRANLELDPAFVRLAEVRRALADLSAGPPDAKLLRREAGPLTPVELVEAIAKS